MGGSSVPSSTTQTTMLDPTRQAALKQAMGYATDWAQSYKGPTYKGPLTAGRTQDWYSAQRMAHNMANRFSEGGITSVRRFDDGGSAAAQPWWAPYYSSQQEAMDIGGYDASAFETPATTTPATTTPATTTPATTTPATTTPATTTPTTTTPATPNYSGALTGDNGYKPFDNGYVGPSAYNGYVGPASGSFVLPDATLSKIAATPNYSGALTGDNGYKPFDNGYVGPASGSFVLPVYNPPAATAPANDTTLSNQPLTLTETKDTLPGGLGAIDTLAGGLGKDTLPGGLGAIDTITGDVGKDTLPSGQAIDTTSGGLGKDTLDKAIADANLTQPNTTPTTTTTNMGNPSLLAQALALKGIGGIYGLTDLNLQPQEIVNTYTNPNQITPGTITTDTWDKAAMDKYMSPYTQGVVDIALREAERQRAIERLKENTAATQSGAFGGYRQGVVEAEGNRNYNQLRNDITTKGYQNAYDTALAQFNAAAQQRLAADQSNQQNAIAAYQANEAAKQRAAEMGMTAGQSNVNNALTLYTDKINALNQNVANTGQLANLDTTYLTNLAAAMGGLNSADASARAADQANIKAVTDLLTTLENLGLTKAQALAEIAGIKGVNSGSVSVTNKS